jgi:hypothetical protein
VYGPGYAGDYSSPADAQRLIDTNKRIGPAALYVRLDVAILFGMDPSGLADPFED